MEENLNTNKKSQIIVRFKNKNSGLYLDVSGAGSKGTYVIQYTRSTANNQKWIMDYQAADDTFIIHPGHAPTTYLNVEGNSSENGAKVIIWADLTPTKWKIVYDEENDAHRIVSEYGDYVKGIAVKDASTQLEAETVIWDISVGGTNDRWIIEYE